MFSLGALLRNQWNDSIESAEVVATNDLEISAGTVKNILSNSYKLLDITNRDLHQLIIDKSMTLNPSKKLSPMLLSYSA